MPDLRYEFPAFDLRVHSNCVVVALPPDRDVLGGLVGVAQCDGTLSAERVLNVLWRDASGAEFAFESAKSITLAAGANPDGGGVRLSRAELSGVSDIVVRSDGAEATNAVFTTVSVAVDLEEGNGR